jgi:hypothetical protein
VSFTDIEKSFEKANSPVNKEPFHIIIIPPEAPTEGRNSNLSNFFGQNFLR